MNLRAYILVPVFLAVMGVSCAQSAFAQEKKKPAKQADIDLVICLDTSNSMDGLINSAKVRLWDIVNELAKAKPTPNLRIALYAYGTPTYGARSGWVKQILSFTGDLDSVYEKLFALRTNGGTEYVARVSQAALDDLHWSKSKNALRLIFVCGNEPANQDPKISLATVSQNAIKKGVIINTIHCKWASVSQQEIKTWEDLANSAEGEYTSIDQSRGTVAITTPHDKKLAELGKKLNGTYLWYGSLGRQRRMNQLAQDANAAKLGAGVVATRANSKASVFYEQADACLVDKAIANPKFDITKIKEKDLPENLRKMKPDQRVKYINEMKAKRLAVQKEITEVNQLRNAYIRKQREAQAGKKGPALDEAIRGVIRKQAKARSITIPGK
ncbi:MAG: VWA domain-containing protein [Gemmataceae bacterium]